MKGKSCSIAMPDVPDDPTDWPKEFLDLRKIDSLLRCSICLEYVNIAVIVPICSHNYCSYCIRKHITEKQCCPTCSVPLLAADLKCNRVLDELVRHFKLLRTRLLEILNAFCKQRLPGADGVLLDDRKSVAAVNRAIEATDNDLTLSQEDFLPTQRMRTPHQKKCPVSRGDRSEGKSLTRHALFPDGPNEASRKDPSHGSSSTVAACESGAKDGGLKNAQCPVCAKAMRLDLVDAHLDACLSKRAGEPSARPKRRPSSPLKSDRARQTKKQKVTAGPSKVQDVETCSRLAPAARSVSDDPARTVGSTDQPSTSLSCRIQTGNDLITAATSRSTKPLPKICCSALTEKQLREKLRAFKLSSKGDKKALTKRVEAYVLLHNAQCDAVRPMSAAEIAHQVEVEEANQSKFGYKPSIVPPTHDARISAEIKEEFQMKYRSENREAFTALIQEIRDRTQKSACHTASKPENRSVEACAARNPVSTSVLAHAGSQCASGADEACHHRTEACHHRREKNLSTGTPKTRAIATHSSSDGADLIQENRRIGAPPGNGLQDYALPPPPDSSVLSTNADGYGLGSQPEAKRLRASDAGLVDRAKAAVKQGKGRRKKAAESAPPTRSRNISSFFSTQRKPIKEEASSSSVRFSGTGRSISQKPPNSGLGDSTGVITIDDLDEDEELSSPMLESTPIRSASQERRRRSASSTESDDDNLNATFVFGTDCSTSSSSDRGNSPGHTDRSEFSISTMPVPRLPSADVFERSFTDDDKDHGRGPFTKHSPALFGDGNDSQCSGRAKREPMDATSRSSLSAHISDTVDRVVANSIMFHLSDDDSDEAGSQSLLRNAPGHWNL